MIVAIGTFEESGGLQTLTNSYQASFAQRNLDVHWILFGSATSASQPSSCKVEPNETRIFLKDNWSFYANPNLCEPEAKEQIQKTLDRLRPNLIFRPLQYTYEPYLSGFSVPQLKMIHLVTAELYESALRQVYRDDKKVQSSLKADLIRIQYERDFLIGEDGLILNSETTRRDLEKHHLNTRYKNSIVSPPGAEDDFFNLTLPSLSRRVLFFGRWNHQKGIPNLFHAVPHYWQFECWGSGKWTENDFAPFGIRTASWQNSASLKKKLSEVSFCVFPSHYEPWGLSLNEALAAGKICVAQSGAGGHEEQIKNGQNGFLIDFSRRSFWEELEAIHSLGEEKLFQVSHEARKTARRWSQHIETVHSELSRLGT